MNHDIRPGRPLHCRRRSPAAGLGET